MLSFNIEPLEKCWNEVMVLASQHWAETEGFRRGEPFAPSYARYSECERIGFFLAFTARDVEKLAGYAGMYVTQSMHSQARIAVEDMWFLSPEYRKGTNAIRFIKYAEGALATRGVTAIQMSAKISNGAGRLLDYLKYTPVSTLYFKSLRIDRPDTTNYDVSQLGRPDRANEVQQPVTERASAEPAKP